RLAGSFGFLDVFGLVASQRQRAKEINPESAPFSVPHLGRPTFWVPIDEQTPLTLELTPPHQHDTRQAILASLGIVALFFLACRLAGSALLASYSLMLWPEAAILFGALTATTMSTPWIGAFLIVLGLSGRIIDIRAWLIETHRPAQPGLQSESKTEALN